MDKPAQNERESLTLDMDTIRYSTRMLWYGMLVYLDFTTSLLFLGPISPGHEQALMLKSAVLIAAIFLVVGILQRE